LPNHDSQAELGAANHRNRARSQIPDVDRPRIPLRVKLGRRRRQRDDRWRIEKFKQLPTKIHSNDIAMRLQMYYLFVLQRVHLADKDSCAYEQYLHNCSIDWFLTK
jgi:hypothetical protein